MKTPSERTTIYLNPYVKHFIQHKALIEKSSISQIINEQLAELLEDLEDGYELSHRQQDPAFIPWLEVKKKLKDDGLI